jgi:hypothetical protein
MNKFLGLLLAATFLAPLNPAQAMDEENDFHSMVRRLDAKVNSLVLDGAEGNEDQGKDALNILGQIETAIRENDESAIIFFDQMEYYKGLLESFGFYQLNNAEPSSSSHFLSEIPAENIEQVERDYALAQAVQALEIEERSSRGAQAPIEGSPQHKIESHLDLYNDFQPVRDFFGSAIYIEAKKQKEGEEIHGIDEFHESLVAIVLPTADKIFPENGKLSLKETADSLKKFLQERPDLLENYSYEGKQVDLATMEAMIDGVYQDDMNPALCSHTFNLARQLFDFGSPDGMRLLLDAVSENSLTHGGCPAGRRNRQLKELCTMLMYNGLGE